MRVTVLCNGSSQDGPYGVDLLEGMGFDLAEVPAASTRLHLKLRDLVEHRLGFPLDRAIRSLPLARKSDLILTFLENQAVFPAVLKRCGLPGYLKKPLVTIACWLTDDMRNMTPLQRQKIVRRYRGVDLIFVFSHNQVVELESYGFPAGQVRAVPFGFAPGQFSFVPQSEKDIPLLAVGSDRGRDYATLFAALREVDAELLLACKDSNIAGMELPKNVRRLGTVPFADYKSLLHRAQTVVVPTHELSYPTGQTVALEAAATGAALVVTGTKPMKEYFSSRTALMPDPHDHRQLSRLLNTALQSRQLRSRLGQAAAELVNEKYTYTTMWQQIVAQIDPLARGQEPLMK